MVFLCSDSDRLRRDGDGAQAWPLLLPATVRPYRRTGRVHAVRDMGGWGAGSPQTVR